jgi:uncharacterized membrane protein YbjE (DUF340 family)
LLAAAKIMKSNSILNAFLIGILIGILIYSIIKNSKGYLSLILLFFIYKFINNSKYDNIELENILKERNLK